MIIQFIMKKGVKVMTISQSGTLCLKNASKLNKTEKVVIPTEDKIRALSVVLQEADHYNLHGTIHVVHNYYIVENSYLHTDIEEITI